MFHMPFAGGQFSHVFVCFVLEHSTEPLAALAALERVLAPNGTITVIEGDHGSWYCYPQTQESNLALRCLVEVQARLGGDALIGRRLYPVLVEAGFQNVRVSPRMAYVDSSRPHLVEGFSKNTYGNRRDLCYTFFKAVATK